MYPYRYDLLVMYPYLCDLFPMCPYLYDLLLPCLEGCLECLKARAGGGVSVHQKEGVLYSEDPTKLVQDLEKNSVIHKS